MINLRCFIFSVLLCLFPPLFSQSTIGTWRSYLSYNQAIAIAEADDKIFCATSGGLFYFNITDNSIQKFSREDGLSDTRITMLKYSSENNTLIIAYATSNIDLVKDNKIINLNDIERKQILGDKTIYNITLSGQHAYLATGFGIIVLDLLSFEFRDTYDKIGPDGTQIKVNEVAFSGEYIYAATDEGILKANLSIPNINLPDYHFWERITSIPGYLGSFSSIVSRNGKIYTIRKGDAGGNDVVYRGDGLTWQIYDKFTDVKCKKLITRGDTLIMIRQYHIDAFDINENKLKDNIFIGNPQSADFDNQGILWIADLGKGMLRNPDEGTLETVVPDGPASESVTGISAKGGRVIAVPGGPSSVWNNQYRAAEVYRFENNQWYNWKNSKVHDFYKVIIDPSDQEHFFIGSWGGGLFEFNEGELINRYQEGNSTLQSAVPGAPFIRIGGMTFDKDNNLWMTNSEVSSPISVMKKDGNWVSFPVSTYTGYNKLGSIVATGEGHKWIQIISGTKGLFVLDDKGTPDELSDDQYKKLNVIDNNNSIITNDILALAEDRDGTLWLGSSKGIILYYSPGRVFTDDDFYAQQIIIPRNDGTGTGDLLLGSEAVTAIAVDGANRKWLGTRNAGVFLVSADGMEQIHSFNTNNSPLLSNSIIDIAIDEESGEVFFGTDKGIISYKSDAISPGDFFNDVYVYPNPVRPDYQGDIVIKGLVAETIVKITDISGNLVYETKSLGGQALWDGMNFGGERVRTGVYLVFCSDREGTMAVVTKVLFIN